MVDLTSLLGTNSPGFHSVPPGACPRTNGIGTQQTAHLCRLV